MLKEIKNNLYCITSYTGNSRFVECDNEEELISYVAETEWKGYTVMSVTKTCADGSRPRVAVKSTPAYMRAIRKLLSGKGNA